MLVSPWEIATWPTVELPSKVWRASLRRMRHIGTRVQTIDDRTGVRSGQMVYELIAQGKRVGLAWDWNEIRPSVPVISDPMNILSNVVLCHESATHSSDFIRLAALNEAVYSSGWQQMISRHASMPRLARAA